MIIFYMYIHSISDCQSYVVPCRQALLPISNCWMICLIWGYNSLTYLHDLSSALIFWQHFIHERRALPFNLSAILDAQLTRSSDHRSTDQRSGHSDTDACDRHACYQLDHTSRCLNACCRRFVCCSSTVYLFIMMFQHVKKLNSLLVCNSDTAYITQLKQQKSKRCYYFWSTSP